MTWCFAASGWWQWKYTVFGYSYTKPAATATSVYVASVDGNLYSLDAAYGTVQVMAHAV